MERKVNSTARKVTLRDGDGVVFQDYTLNDHDAAGVIAEYLIDMNGVSFLDDQGDEHILDHTAILAAPSPIEAVSSFVQMAGYRAVIVPVLIYTYEETVNG